MERIVSTFILFRDSARQACLLLSRGLLILAIVAGSALGESVEPLSYRERLELHLNGKRYAYYSFSAAEPVELEVKGPAQLILIIRLLLSGDGPRQETGQLSITADQAKAEIYLFSIHPSSKAAFQGRFADGASRPETILLSVPEGIHRYCLRLERPAGATAAVHADLDRAWEWSYSASLTSTYDDNIYRYSPQDIDGFVYHRADERYRMETYDDLVSSPSLTLSLTRRFQPHLESCLRLRYRYNIYTVNRDKNYQTLSAFLRISAQEQGYIQLGYFHLPKFLIRPYWDQDVFSTTAGDPATYKACDFARDLCSVKLGHRLIKSLRWAIFYDRDRLYYNSHFTEYDTRAHGLGLELAYDLAPWLEMSAEYAFTRAEAKGFDEAGETKAASDDSDISYDQDGLQATMKADLSRHIAWPLELTVRYQLARRYFTTEKSIQEDPFHAGRRDDIQSLALEAQYKLSRRLSLSGAYEIQTRNISSPEARRITEVKNYDRHRLSLGIEFTSD